MDSDGKEPDRKKSCTPGSAQKRAIFECRLILLKKMVENFKRHRNLKKKLVNQYGKGVKKKEYHID